MNELHLPVGYMIKGRWTGRKYVITHMLGRGGMGKVYKAYNTDTKREVAVKIGRNLASLTKEYECLKKLQGAFVVPEVYFLDDCKLCNETYHFFSMELINGQNLKVLMGNQRFKFKEVLNIVLLITVLLNRLHSMGFIYCDLKPENIIYNTETKKIKLIDFGGIVEKGKGVKEFTPCFDRACWGIGSRWADERYDIFSLSMLLYVLLKGKVVLPKNKKKKKIAVMVNGLKTAHRVKEVLKKGFFQRYSNTVEFYNDLKNIKDQQNTFKIKKESLIDLVLNLVFISSLILNSVFFIIALKKLGMV